MINLNEDKEINEYYHDELEKALGIMWTILDVEAKHNVQLPKYLIGEVEKFVGNFKFRYSE